MVNKVEISYRTIIFIAIFILGIWLVFQIRDILLLLFVSFILMSALNPLVDRLEKSRIPRALAILIIYIIGLTILSFVVTIIIPPLANQTIKLGAKLPEFINSLFPFSKLTFDTIFQQFLPVGEGIVKLSVGIFSNIITIVTFLVFTFYFLLENKRIEQYIINFIGVEGGKRFINVISNIEDKLGAWVRGELALMTIIGLASFTGLTILGIDYALPLGIIAGLLEVVPIIGPILSAVPAILVAFGTSPGLALIVVVLYILIQQFENNFIVPTVMRRAVGLPPLVTILALMVGGRLAGIGGAILSVPLVVILQIVLKDILASR